MQHTLVITQDCIICYHGNSSLAVPGHASRDFSQDTHTHIPRATMVTSELTPSSNRVLYMYSDVLRTFLLQPPPHEGERGRARG